MATNVSANNAAVIESFARNQTCRESNLNKIVFVTERTLEGKPTVNAQTQEPVSYQVIFDAFRSLNDKTAEVQRAIDANAQISPTLATAHQVLQERIGAVSESVQIAAEQTGVISKRDEQVTEQTGIVQEDDQTTGQSGTKAAIAVASVGVLGGAAFAASRYAFNGGYGGYGAYTP